MTETRKIAVLIPEFPGQTHSFFWREIEALHTHHGIGAQIISTRLAPRPVMHDWVAQANAIQLHPMPPARMVALTPALAAALPRLMADPDLRRILRQPRSWGFVLMALELARICKARRLTHLHVHSCANFALIAALCHRLSGIPYSLVLHGRLVDYGPEQPLKWKGASFVFVITKILRQEVAEVLPQMMDKVRVVPMGVNTDMFAPPDRPRPDDPDPFTWFCCARLNWVKGHDTLIRAATILRRDRSDLSFCIRIAGEDEKGGSGYHRDLDRLIAEEDAGDLVQLLGSVTQDDVRQELQSADGFVLASRHEPLGVAYMEAMACELPVIGTDAGGVAELITQGADGMLIPPNDPQALARAMAQVIEDAALRRRMGQAARQKILRNFSSRRSADALALALHECDRP
ncbi:exopolysaccharide biosynthesis GT4 family glycosyltransferase EpsE [Paracoccus beibuensis]|uniref:exopolysaccharide biosynthesis GT4 family glycosyltransferase EpsE n=1 Tax=Paracoccus beibuensis TaxID=547602 RepID=UPI002240AD90|nr:exopolysaccharide biosynthesis GT4 family glycosyltransferase EpsE [Paracoccus beibuensis]